MNAKYKKLLALMAQTMANTAEKAMEQNKEKGDLAAYQTSMDMRDTHQNLVDKLKNNDYTLTKEDYASLCIAAYVVIQTIETRVKKEQATIIAYNTDLLPKLKAAMEDPERAEEIFKEEKK